ncbi:hypothetical protein Tco_1148609, partial [Tanacetum coccineum]
RSPNTTKQFGQPAIDKRRRWNIKNSGSSRLIGFRRIPCVGVITGAIVDSLGGTVGIKSLLNATSITVALIDVNAAQSKLYKVNVAEGVNAGSEEVSTAELVSTAYVICMRYFGKRYV